MQISKFNYYFPVSLFLLFCFIALLFSFFMHAMFIPRLLLLTLPCHSLHINPCRIIKKLKNSSSHINPFRISPTQYNTNIVWVFYKILALSNRPPLLNLRPNHHHHSQFPLFALSNWWLGKKLFWIKPSTIQYPNDPQTNPYRPTQSEGKGNKLNNDENHKAINDHNFPHYLLQSPQNNYIRHVLEKKYAQHFIPILVSLFFY